MRRSRDRTALGASVGRGPQVVATSDAPPGAAAAALPPVQAARDQEQTGARRGGAAGEQPVREQDGHAPPAGPVTDAPPSDDAEQPLRFALRPEQPVPADQIRRSIALGKEAAPTPTAVGAAASPVELATGPRRHDLRCYAAV